MIMFKTRGGGNSSSLVIAKSVLTQYNPTRLTGTKIWNMKNARYVATPADPSQVPPIKQLAVIGAGQMGLGIALVASRVAGIPVHLIDNSQASIDKGSKFLAKLLDKDVKRDRLKPEDAEAITKRVNFTQDFDASVKSADFIIEAVPEIIDLKLGIFGRLASLVGPNTVLATNTSSISITKIAAAAKGAEDRVVATHFMNPVPVQPGVEIISALQTSSLTLARALDLVNKMKKVPSISEDRPGFIANRILVPYINEAILLYENGVATKEDIDKMMVNGCAMPMGPLALADFIGLDTCLSICEVLHRDTGDSKYRPAVLLQNYVNAGWLGKKTGRGFYEYPSL